jgi:hypothetical protein
MPNENNNLKKILWENVRALMLVNYGRENLNRLARDTKIGPGSATRIKEQRTAVKIDTLEKIAKHFKVQPWQLIAPGLSDEKFLEVLRAWEDTDGRGRRMLLAAAEGAREEDEPARSERAAGKVIRG